MSRPKLNCAYVRIRRVLFHASAYRTLDAISRQRERLRRQLDLLPSNSTFAANIHTLTFHLRILQARIESALLNQTSSTYTPRPHSYLYRRIPWSKIP